MPRHLTASPLCIMCRLRAAVCVCPQAPRLDVATRVVLVIHAAEWARVTNTGHLLRLALRDVDVRLQGLPHRPVRCDGIDPAGPSTRVLYPGRGAVPLTAAALAAVPRPATLLVPDGNWRQARNMMRRVPMLRDARPVRLAEPGLDLPALRRNRDDDRRSTFEAVAQVLGLLDGPETERRLLDFFREFLGRKRAT